jgi:hypothetical protein
MSLKKMNNIIDGLETLLSSKMEDIVLAASDEQGALMAELNREQLTAGIRSDGSKITPPYAPATVAIKKKKGQPTDRVTLQDKKDFVNAIKVRRLNKVQYIQSTDPKNPDLKKKYGNEIEGLTDENIAIVSVACLPDIYRLTKAYLQL